MKRKVMLGILFLISVVLCMAPFIYAAQYTFYMADDFSFANMVLSYGKGNYILRALVANRDIYLKWQGTYLVNFALCFSPIVYSNMHAYKIIMICFDIFLIISIYIFMTFIGEKTRTNSRYVNLVFIVALATLLNFRFYTDIFYWYNGFTAYGLPISLGLMGVSFMIYSEKCKKKLSHLFFVLAVLCMALMAGGSLQVVGVVCYIDMFILVDDWHQTRKISKHYMICLLVSVSCAVINVLAPGNYIRHGCMDKSGLHFGTAFRVSIEYVIRESADLLCNKYVVCGMLFVLIAGLLMLPKTKSVNKYSLVKIALIMFMPIVNCFPVFLGYSYNGEYEMSSRFNFVLDLNIILVMISIITYATTHIEIICKQDILVLASLLTIFIFPVMVSKAGHSCWVATVRDLKNGDIQRYSKSVIQMYDEIDNSSDKDVIIYDMNVDAPQSFSEVTLSINPSDWPNYVISEYYGKRSVKMGNRSLEVLDE